MKVKRILALIFTFCVLSIGSLTAACAPYGSSQNSASEESGKTSRVRYAPVPEGAEEYTGAELYFGSVAGEKLPLYNVKVNVSQTWTPNDYQRADSGVGYFELEGKADIVVKVPYEIDYASKLRPLSAGVIPVADLDARTLSFTLESAGEYVLEINGDPLKAIHLFVSEYGKAKEDFSGYRQVVTFGKGLHTGENSPYIDENNTVNLHSDTAVYLEDGAVVRAKFNAYGAENILICGRGVIDGSAFERDAEAGSVTVPLDFSFCKNVTLKEFSCLDPAGWCVNFYFTEDSYIDDIKIITSRSNGDGISLQSCKNIEVTGCFVRTWDDSLVVKNYPEWSDRSKQGSTENISFGDCTIWTDLAQCMEIGYETVGETMRNISFENITVLHALHKPVFSIHNANNAHIGNVEWKNITVEDASLGAESAANKALLVEVINTFSSTWSTNHATTSLGEIDGVKISNVLVLSGGKYVQINISGCRDVRAGYESDHYVKNVSLDRITWRDETLSPASSALDFKVGSFVDNVSLAAGEKATGASFVKNASAAALSAYGSELSVERL